MTIKGVAVTHSLAKLSFANPGSLQSSFDRARRKKSEGNRTCLLVGAIF